MRKYLDIPLTIGVTLTLTVAMLWPLEAPPPAPEGSDKLVHFIAFAALAFPLARTGASVYCRSSSAPRPSAAPSNSSSPASIATQT